ncbi:MAG: leucine-rich repeat domain-containing protein [Lachnospiraceae bacterium]|nr:leucine-rich repeat domain-containing protein [Lachnospiraceae bacterium]
MDKLNFGGELIYKDGWFVYIRNNHETSVLTREDARMLEDAYRDYQNYAQGVTGTEWFVEGVRPFEEYGISKSRYRYSQHKVDELAPESSDITIGNVLEIPARVGNYTINTVLQNSFQNLKISMVVLPETIRKISRGAFEHCESLEQIIFGDNIPDISGAFQHCPRIIYLKGFLRMRNTIVKADSKLSGHVIVPEGVEHIMPEAFANNQFITSVSLPTTIKSIGKYAFNFCTKLSNVFFPASVPELTLGENVFCYCDSLTEVAFPEGLTVLPEGTFSLCKSITRVTFPSTLTQICRWAFDRSKFENDFKQSSETCLYVDNWLVDIKQVPIAELIVKEGTIGIATQAPHFPRKPNCDIGPIQLPASLRYLNAGALVSIAESDLDLKNVEYISHDALVKVHTQTIHVPATCKSFGAENIRCHHHLRDIYFHNPDTVITIHAHNFGSIKPTTVHGYEGSTAAEFCKNFGARYNLTFVPMKD